MDGRLITRKGEVGDWKSGPLREDGDHQLVGIIFQDEGLSPERMRYAQKSASRKVRLDLKGTRHPCLRDGRVEGNWRKRGQNMRETAEG